MTPNYKATSLKHSLHFLTYICIIRVSIFPLSITKEWSGCHMFTHTYTQTHNDWRWPSQFIEDYSKLQLHALQTQGIWNQEFWQFSSNQQQWMPLHPISCTVMHSGWHGINNSDKRIIWFILKLGWFLSVVSISVMKRTI